MRAKSKFWYFIRQFKRIKRMNGEIMACNEVRRPLPWALAWRWVAEARRGSGGGRLDSARPSAAAKLRAGEGKRLRRDGLARGARQDRY